MLVPALTDCSPSPLVEGGEELQSVRAGTNINIHTASVLRGSLECVLPGVESSDGEAVTEGLGELELRTVGAREGVLGRVKLESAGQGEGHGHLGAGDEAVSGGVSVITTCEVSVVAGNNGVLLPLLHILSVPLTNAGPAGVSEHDTPELPHGVGRAVPLDGGPDLLAARSDVEGALGLEALVQRLLHQRAHSAHVLVAGVCAGADQTVLDLQRPALGLGSVRQL